LTLGRTLIEVRDPAAAGEEPIFEIHHGPRTGARAVVAGTGKGIVQVPEPLG
jgi:hypothetical protein